jgi:hypothetical protein
MCCGLLAATESTAPAQNPTYKYQHGSNAPRLMSDELNELERQRAELGLGGPIAFTIVGGVTALTGGLFLLIGLALDSIDSSCEPSGDGYFDDDDYCSDPDGTPLIVIGAVGLAVGVVILAIALPSLFSRIDERRALGVRIKQLRRERYGGQVFTGDGPRLARSSPLLKLRF